MDKKYKEAIVTGIISSVIFSMFLQPIAIKLFLLLKTSGLDFYTDFYDRIFCQAALGYRHDVERLFYAVFLALIFFLTFSYFSLFFKEKNKMFKVIKNTQAEDEKTKKQMIRVSVVALQVFIAIFFLFSSFRFMMEGVLIFSSTELNASFDQRIKILAPYLSEAQEDDLISDWASMNNEDDYLEINKNLESIATQNNRVLPKILWPDVLWSTMAWR